MTHLAWLQPNSSIRGILPDCLGTVVGTQWFGSEALKLTYKDPTGRVAKVLLYRHDESHLEVLEQGRPWGFDGEGAVSPPPKTPHPARAPLDPCWTFTPRSRLVTALHKRGRRPS